VFAAVATHGGAAISNAGIVDLDDRKLIAAARRASSPGA